MIVALSISPHDPQLKLAEFYKQSHNYSFWVDKIFKDISKAYGAYLAEGNIYKKLLQRISSKPTEGLEVGAAYGYFLDAITEKEHEEIVCIGQHPSWLNSDRHGLPNDRGYRGCRLKTKFSCYGV